MTRTRFLIFMTVTVLIMAGLYCPAAFGGEPASAAHPWRIGFAQADITPPAGQVQMTGYGRERYAEGALAPLLTQAVAFEDRQGVKAILIAADVLGFDRVMVTGIRRAIQAKHGLPPERIMLSASHTHWGPAVKFAVGYSIGAPNVWYMGRLEDRMLACVDEAIKDLASASLDYGSMDFRGIGCNRRRPVNGKIGWGPYREGSFDGHTPVMRVQWSRRQGAKTRQLILVGHACHPTSSGAIQKWSPGYPGALRDRLAEALPGAKAMFVQGCGADAKVVHTDPGSGHLVFTNDAVRAKAAGVCLGDAVLDHLKAGGMKSLDAKLACSLASGRISFGERWSRETLEALAYPKPGAKGVPRNWNTWTARQMLALPDARQDFQYDVQAWKLGGRLMLFGLEGEVCSPWGPLVRAMAPTEEAMVIGYANNTGSYIPDSRIIREGGYEGLVSQHVYGLPGPFTEKIDEEVRKIVAKAVETVQ